MLGVSRSRLWLLALLVVASLDFCGSMLTAKTAGATTPASCSYALTYAGLSNVGSGVNDYVPYDFACTGIPAGVYGVIGSVVVGGFDYILEACESSCTSGVTSFPSSFQSVYSTACANSSSAKCADTTDGNYVNAIQQEANFGFFAPAGHVAFLNSSAAAYDGGYSTGTDGNLVAGSGTLPPPATVAPLQTSGFVAYWDSPIFPLVVASILGVAGVLVGLSMAIGYGIKAIGAT